MRRLGEHLAAHDGKMNYHHAMPGTGAEPSRGLFRFDFDLMTGGLPPRAAATTACHHVARRF